MKAYPLWGSDRTYPHMAVPWTWAFDTPFSWTKQIASHFGGVRQGMAISWPKVIKDKGGIRNQFPHIIDIVPTLLEATNIGAPSVVDGIAQKPIEGTSLAYTFDAANRNAPSRHHTQYFEMLGDHAIYHDGWIASTKVMRPPWIAAGSVSQDPASFPSSSMISRRTGRRPTTSPSSIRKRSRRWRTSSGARRRSTRCCRWTLRSRPGSSRQSRAYPRAARTSPGWVRSPARPTVTPRAPRYILRLQCRRRHYR